MCWVVSSWPSDTVKAAFGIGLISFQFIIPCVVLVLCYGKIVWVLTRRINADLIKTESKEDDSDNDRGSTVNQAADTGRDKFLLARRNTINTLLIVGLCFIICWSQNQVRYLMYSCGYDLGFDNNYHEFTTLMVFINCTVNPFIYLIKYRDYQEALWTFLNCNKEQSKNISSYSAPKSISQISKSS